MNSATPPNREKDIFEQALDLPSGAERLAFVKGACGADAALCARVLALLAAHATTGDFLPEGSWLWLLLRTASELPPAVGMRY
jgi:hypothetical protein